MSFGCGDIIAISELAARVITGYIDAPEDYGHISNDVKALGDMIDDAKEHFEGTYLSDKRRETGQVVLKGCESVLADLNDLVEKYKSLDSNKKLDWNRIKFVKEDITPLRQRLITNTGFLTNFLGESVIPLTPV